MSELEAGRELDALIEERIFGNPVDREFDEPIVKARRDKYDQWGVLPPYSTDMGAAWEVVEHLNHAAPPGRLKLIQLGYPPKVWECTLFRMELSAGHTARAETAPLAICKAALAALADAA